MAGFDDYYKRNKNESLLAAQEAARQQGSDPALAGQGMPVAPQSTLATAAGAAPGASSYVSQQPGGATSGSRNVLDVITGQDNTHITPALQSALPDAGDVEMVAAAKAEQQRQIAEATAAAQDIKAQIEDAQRRGDAASMFRLAMELQKANVKINEVTAAKPDLAAIQHQSDRNRLLNIGGAAYAPLIAALSSAAEGNGPSAALNYYRSAADDAAKRTYGMAASARGTGGQKAALFQAALGQNAEAAQGAARQAAIIGAEEQNQARAALNAALTGQTNVYGTANLLGDTQGQQKANQDAQNAAIGLQADISKSNAANSSRFAGQVLDTTGKALTA